MTMHKILLGVKSKVLSKGLIVNIRKIIKKFGSLEKCFMEGFSKNDENIIPAMIFFVNNLTTENTNPGHLVANPLKGSACKRMNLFLRWMIRKDSVDPGGWNGIPKSKLIVPLDTHMHKIALSLGMTNKKQANLRAAIEITEHFKIIMKDDPVRFDFALTRFGIRKDMNFVDLIDRL